MANSFWPLVGKFFLITLIAFSMTAVADALPQNCVVGTNVYYIDNTVGSDSNSQAAARSKSTPWAHQPYMHSFTGTYSHTPGDCFVFKGGDTWNVGTTDYFNISQAGNSSAPDYYGVDQTWYGGATWNRPIFDVQGDLPNVSSGASKIFNMTGSASWITFDWLEVIHGTCSASGGGTAQYYFPINDTGTTISNGYFHAFETPSAGCGTGVTPDGNQMAIWIDEQVGTSACGGSFDHNIVDGSDGTGAKGYDVIVYDVENCMPIVDNVVHDLCSAFGGNFSLAYGNLIYNFGGALTGTFDCVTQGIHAHAIRSNYSATIHDNVIHDADDGNIKVNTGFSGSATNASYIFNNVEYHNADSWYAIEECDYGSGCNAGHLYVWNNTLDCSDSDLCVRVDSSIASLWIANEHHISTSGGSGITGSSNAGTYTYSASQNLYQTYTQAGANTAPRLDLYSGSQTYVYSPTASTNSTVGIGTNLASSWPSGYSTNDTSYACSQGTVNGVVEVVCPARVSNPRPPAGSGAWDVGAYQFGGASITPPSPSPGLSAAAR